MTAEIRVSAAVVTDAAGRALVVRKAGTAVFMQPGGKPEPGETAAQALIRELAEEIGVRVPEAALVPLGEFATDAANEPGHRVVADAFLVDLDPADVVPAAEIAEALWIARDDATTPLAPLSRDLLLPLVWR
ncbi:NUDIX domain-containing protein [Microbacterium ulmi]|uniref:NUDIX domain-containing protein n=1 Tax=Microbacterium ulmi TaxID=179095 RepID=A0A7Y2M2U7_9MICO|nr:8-oxo-dGTP pyrophosphatase MutT (NUDIX family) [Microbacterium ulmi]NNH05465.1 NUDIX domain-containing protein [Microbacterium ulmi]